MLGRRVPFMIMNNRIQNLWAVRGQVRITDMGAGFFTARFDSSEDYRRALMEGPWKIGEHYIVPRLWQKGFDPCTDTLSHTLVWVRLPGLLLEFFTETFLRRIGDKIGQLVRIDPTTLAMERGNYARICVRVDQSKKLLSKYKLLHRIRLVEYEGLHVVCFKCGIYGHTNDICPSATATADLEGEQVHSNPLFLEEVLAKERPEVPPRPPVGKGTSTSSAADPNLAKQNARKKSKAKKGVGLTPKVEARSTKPTGKRASKMTTPKAAAASNTKGKGASQVTILKRQRPAGDKAPHEPLNDVVRTEGHTPQARQAPDITAVVVDMNVDLPTAASLVFIFEPRISGVHARQVICTLGFTSSFVVDAIGFSGGIWVLWKEHDVNISVREHSNQLVHLECSVDGGDYFFVFGVYDSPRGFIRMELWDHIRELHQRTRGPWLLCGDFNSIRTMDDKVGGAAFNSARCREFNQCADDCQLLDVDFTGPRFTWFHGQIRQRLDRAVCNAEWTMSFPEVVVRHLPRIRSDHRPILIHCLADLVPHRSIRPFRFVAAWLEHDTFPPTLKNAWSYNVPTPAALTSLQSKLRRWNKDIFGNIFQRKKQLVLHLGNLESLNEERPTTYSLDLETKVRRELETTLWQENFLWRQKSRSNWVSDGDRNTRFFHVATMKRRKHNKITGLRNEMGVWVHDQASLRRLACEYFRELFSSSLPKPGSLPAAFQVKNNSSLSPLWRAVKKVTPVMRLGMRMGLRDGAETNFWLDRWVDGGERLIDFTSGHSSGIYVDQPVNAFVSSHEEESAALDPIWRLIWRWKGPQRIWQFLWLVAHNQLLTNSERHRRHLAEIGSCQTPLLPWIESFLRKPELCLLFGVTCWWLWHARNDRVFNNKLTTADSLTRHIQVWVALVGDTLERDRFISHIGPPTRTGELIVWEPAPPEWVTLNSDGSVISASGHVAAGGLIRDHQGRCLAAFTLNLGKCSITRAELRGAVSGLQLAWERGYRKIQLQLDSHCAVQLLHGEGLEDHAHAATIMTATELLRRNWEVQILHVYRE
ncbi:Putative ribonuclease H protein At1g65750, partial [Linum perenne]